MTVVKTNAVCALTFIEKDEKVKKFYKDIKKNFQIKLYTVGWEWWKMYLKV